MTTPWSTQRRAPMRAWVVTLVAFGLCAQMALATMAECMQPGPPPEDRPESREPAEGLEASPPPRDEAPLPENRLPAFGPRPGRGHRSGPPPGLWRRMSEPERQRVVEFIEEHFPRLYIELERHKERKPQAFARQMKRVVPEMLRLMEMMEVHPERGTLMIQERRVDMEIRRAAQQYRSARKEEKRSRLRDRMRDLCGQAFDCRHRRRELEIRELEGRLEELKQRHDQAAEMRKKLIEQQVKERLDRPAPRPAKADEEQ